MMYSPSSFEPIPAMVGTFSSGLTPIPPGVGMSTPSSAVFESANRAVYIPLRITAVCVVRRLWWANGSTVSASYNVDVGIYADAGYKPGAKLIATGSTAQGTATEVQFVDVTDTTLAPGRYWLAIACSSASATFLRATVGASGYMDAAWRFEEASALPLPATATPVEASSANIYLFGFATTASP